MAKRRSRNWQKSIQVFGEILITAGTILMLYVVWQLFINDPLISIQQEKQATAVTTSPTAEAKPFNDIKANLKQGKVFARIYIPRFGKDYVRQIGQGTFQKVTLNTIGVGHYLNTQWPGQVGNFAVAAHRTSHGAPFNKIDELTTGDLIFIETNDSWFTYKYLETKVVDPTNIGVISKVPAGLTNAIAGGSYLTMTSCHPKWSNKQRIVVWSNLISSSPRSNGMPRELMELQR